MAEQVVTKDILMKRILQLENAGDSANAQLVRDILNRDYPNAQAEMGDPALEPYPYTEEQLEMDLQNKEARKLGDATFADSERTRMNQHLLSENMGGAVAASTLSGAMFAGEYVDEAVGAVMGEEKMEQVRRLQMAFEEEYPKTNIALRLAGGVGSAIPMATLGATQKAYKFIQGLPTGYKYLAQAFASAGFGSIEGLFSGAGIQGADETGGTQSRGENMFDLGLSGAIWGSVGGVGGQMLTDVGALAWVRIKDGLKNQTIPEIKELFNLTSNKTAEIIKRHVESTNVPLSEMLKNIQKGGSQGTIPDADAVIASMLDMIVIAGGKGGATVVNKVDDRAKLVARGVDNSLNRNIAVLNKDKDGISDDVATIAKELAQSTAPARSKAYTKAYAEKINYNGSEGAAIKEVLDRIPPEIKQKALKKANNKLIMDGMPQGQNGIDVGEDGIFFLVNNPNMLQLDYIKRGLSELAYGTDDVMKKGGMQISPDAMDYIKLRGKLNEALKNVNKPKNGESAYSKATRLGQDKIQRNNALDIGADILNPSLNRKTVSKIMADAGDAEKEMARLGLRGSIEELLANVKKTINSPDIDLNQMNKLLQTLSTDNVKGKLKLLLGDQKAKSVEKTLQMAETALNLKAAVQKGSQTMVRKVSQDNTNEILDQGIFTQFLKGRPDLAASEGIKKLLRGDIIIGKAKHNVMKELANALLGTKGITARQQYKALYESVKRGEATDDQILKISELIASRLTIAPINFTQQVMQDTEMENNLMLGVADLLQR